MGKKENVDQNNISPNSRRRFLTKGTSLLLGAMAITSATSGISPSQNSKRPKGKLEEQKLVFDCHLHCPAESGEAWQWHKITKDYNEFVNYLDKCGVHRGIINSQRSYAVKPQEFIAGNREIAKIVEKSKGRFLGSCVVNPKYIDEALKEIEYCHTQLGFEWVGELCNYMVPYDYSIKEFRLLVEEVTKLNMVLALHTEQGEMEYITQNFPDATIAFAHFGDDHEYADIFKRIDMVSKNQNYYLDTSGYGHDRVGVLEYAIQTIGPDRVLFGSDFSINDPGTVIARIQNSLLSEEQKNKIFSGNLLSLLHKKQKDAKL